MNKWIKGTILSVGITIGFSSSFAIAADTPLGKFRMAEEVKLITLDPHNHTGGGLSYLRPVYETLFYRTPDARIEPLLATSYKLEGMTLEITLREDVKFSDGEPFNAKAVVANITRGIELGVLAGLKPVEKAEAIGDYKVLITLKAPSPSLLLDLTGNSGMMVSPIALQAPALDRNPVGTGPYVYNAEMSREGEVRIYTPNPTYWEPEQIGLESIEIWEIPDNTARLNAITTGQVDIGKWLSSPQAVILDKTPGLTLIKRPGGSTYHLVISDREGTKVPAFADKRVRQAMNYAIDREAFAAAVQFGLSVPAFQPVDSGHWSYNTAVDGRFAYNPDKARELLAEAGYADGFTFTMPSIPVFSARLEAIAGFFQDVGITMNIDPIEPGTLARRSRTTDYAATNLVWRHLADPSLLTTYYIGESGIFNPFKVKPSDKLSKLVADGLAAKEIDQRAPIYSQVFEQLADESYLIYITATPLLVGTTDDVANNPTVNFRAGESSPYWRGLRMSQ